MRTIIFLIFILSFCSTFASAQTTLERDADCKDLVNKIINRGGSNAEIWSWTNQYIAICDVAQGYQIPYSRQRDCEDLQNEIVNISHVRGAASLPRAYQVLCR